MGPPTPPPPARPGGGSARRGGAVARLGHPPTLGAPRENPWRSSIRLRPPGRAPRRLPRLRERPPDDDPGHLALVRGRPAVVAQRIHPGFDRFARGSQQTLAEPLAREERLRFPRTQRCDSNGAKRDASFAAALAVR